MKELTQDEYLKRCVTPKDIETTHGWGLKSLYGHYSLYRGGIGVSEEYRVYDLDKASLKEKHKESFNRMIKTLSKLVLDYLYRKNVLSREEYLDIEKRLVKLHGGY